MHRHHGKLFFISPKTNYAAGFQWRWVGKNNFRVHFEGIQAFTANTTTNTAYTHITLTAYSMHTLKVFSIVPLHDSSMRMTKHEKNILNLSKYYTASRLWCSSTPKDLRTLQATCSILGRLTFHSTHYRTISRHRSLIRTPTVTSTGTPLQHSKRFDKKFFFKNYQFLPESSKVYPHESS